MKFYTSHQIALHNAIIEHGFVKTDFSFSKKKGRIIANHQHSKATFSFMERRESTLDTTSMRITDKFSYELKVNGIKLLSLMDWDALLQEFNDWLATIKSNI